MNHEAALLFEVFDALSVATSSADGSEVRQVPRPGGENVPYFPHLSLSLRIARAV
jgi:hypothetical protein